MSSPRPLHTAAQLLLTLLVALQPAWVALTGAAEHGCDEACCCAPRVDEQPTTKPSCCSMRVEHAAGPGLESERCSCSLRPAPQQRPARELAPPQGGAKTADELERATRSSAATPLQLPPWQALDCQPEAEPPAPRVDIGAPGAPVRRLAQRGVGHLLAFFGVFLR